eukprot:8213973-Lingulodinium_polyedra.AAC.1
MPVALCAALRSVSVLAPPRCLLEFCPPALPAICHGRTFSGGFGETPVRVWGSVVRRAQMQRME